MLKNYKIKNRREFFVTARSEVLVAVVLKVRFFSNVTLCRWVGTPQSFEGSEWPYIWNAGNYLPKDDTAKLFRRFESSPSVRGMTIEEQKQEQEEQEEKEQEQEQEQQQQ